MTTLTEASLTESERRVLERYVRLLQDEFGLDLHSVWLYGSRARGESPGPESDIDLLVVADGNEWENLHRVGRLELQAAMGERGLSPSFSTQVYSPQRLAQRREIRSFFIQEVDRDKIVLFGEP